jgi:hypothetical protein
LHVVDDAGLDTDLVHPGRKVVAQDANGVEATADRELEIGRGHA